MAQFEGIQWATRQMQYLLTDKQINMLPGDAKVYAVSRSTHYGLFLAFEGIRFFCRKNPQGQLEVVLLNWNQNIERFRRGIAFNLGQNQQALVPTADELVNIFLTFFRHPEIAKFLADMAETQAQGYLRPFTIDEDQSIGVTFPAKPAIRAVLCRYTQYLGEPFSGVVIPQMVRAVGANGTGCLKLGINYLISAKAVDAAKNVLPGAASALFLDDNPFQEVTRRKITEWDSSCCLIALTDNTVIKIPESNLILPSVTIQGVVALLRSSGVKVVERDFTYGELIEKARADQIVAICSVGTAGILNRCDKLVLIDTEQKILAEHVSHKSHPLFQTLGELKTRYWNIYKGKEPVPAGFRLDCYEI
jgi:branched-subunit amino acid aminotransferase/4-amino-4-deoxychorismate lyase